MPEYKAVADLGTNSFHLIIAEITDDGKLNTVQREKVVMRLGTEEKNVLKRISPNEIKRSVEVLKEFKKLADFYNTKIYAVATSAIRESENRKEFSGEVKKETGIEINIIDGRTEAEFIYNGVRTALPVNDKKILCIDIGGGSTEIIIGRNSDFDFINSFRIGAVRLSKLYFPGYLLTAGSINKCSDHIENILRESGLTKFRGEYEIAIGASGTIQAIAGIVSFIKYGNAPGEMNGFTFTSDELNEAAEYILKFPTFEERTMIKGIEPGRADILPAGTLILKIIFSTLAVREMSVSGYALREGFLLSMLKNKPAAG